MLVDAVVTAFLGALTGLLGLLPSGDGVSLDLSPAFGVMLTLDGFLPLHEALSAAGLAARVVAAVFAFGVLRQAWRFVPLVGGG